MRVGLYARVSTLNGQHPEMQLAELHEYTVPCVYGLRR
jgi:DNA invertase Pin-like site-specific DNA recombinase